MGVVVCDVSVDGGLEKHRKQIARGMPAVWERSLRILLSDPMPMLHKPEITTLSISNHSRCASRPEVT